MILPEHNAAGRELYAMTYDINLNALDRTLAIIAQRHKSYAMAAMHTAMIGNRVCRAVENIKCTFGGDVG